MVLLHLRGVFYLYDTIPLKNDTYHIFNKNAKHFFLFSVFGLFKVEMWNISIKSIVSCHWICHKCVIEVEYFAKIWLLQIVFFNLQCRNRGHSMVTKLDFFSCSFLKSH